MIGSADVQSAPAVRFAAAVRAYKHADKPLSLCPPERDPKMRFLWRMGSSLADSTHSEPVGAPVVPAAFPEWAARMNGWGGRLLDALTVVAQMAAVGLGLPVDALTSRMHGAPHLLAPTVGGLCGSLRLRSNSAHVSNPQHVAPRPFSRPHCVGLRPLALWRRGHRPCGLPLRPRGTDNPRPLALPGCWGRGAAMSGLCIAALFLLPLPAGLHVWARDGHRMPVKMPAGCLLVQAGKQLEYVTGVARVRMGRGM